MSMFVFKEIQQCLYYKTLDFALDHFLRATQCACVLRSDGRGGFPAS